MNARHNFRVCEWKKDGKGSHRPDIYGVTPATSTTRFSINVCGVSPTMDKGI